METPLEIAFKDTDKSEFLESLIRRQAERLDRHFPKLIGCRVVVDVPHRSPGSGKVPLRVTVEVEAPGRKTFVGREEQQTHAAKDDTTTAVNRAFDAVQRQLDDYSELRRRDVKRHAGAGDTGRVLRLFPEHDYGFVEVVGKPELYFARNAVEEGAFDALEVGMMVEVTEATTEGPMGPQASSVRRRGGDRTG
jgi:ribosome-associated translation inhibitor RaiA/cold shock CspA family protein